MVNEFLPYIPLYDWDGDGDIDADDAMVYLSRHLRVRVTDPQKNPLPEAKCRIVGEPENVYVCDGKGVALIPIPEGASATVDIEWEKADAVKTDPSNRFYWSNRYRVDVASRGDDDCAKRLTHLGFTGETLTQQVEAYQAYFGRTTKGLISEICREMADWHDGGMYPGQVVDGGQNTPVKYVRVCLLDSNKKKMPFACCKRIDADGMEFIADADGMVQIQVAAETECVKILWGSSGTAQADDEERYSYGQILQLLREDDDEQVVMSKILNNMGFEGDSGEQKYAYEQFFSSPLGRSSDDVNSTLTQWSGTGSTSNNALV